MIYTYIDTYKFMQPSVTLLEAAGSFQKRHNIDENLYTVNSLVAIYLRVNQDLIDAQRTGK